MNICIIFFQNTFPINVLSQAHTILQYKKNLPKKKFTKKKKSICWFYNVSYNYDYAKINSIINGTEQKEMLINSRIEGKVFFSF